MPGARALEINRREALGILEEGKKPELVADGPNLGLEGVAVRGTVLVADGIAPQEEGGSKPGEKRAGQPLMRGKGPQQSIYGDKYITDWHRVGKTEEREGTWW